MVWYDELKKVYKFSGTEGNDACKVDRLYIFDSEDNYNKDPKVTSSDSGKGSSNSASDLKFDMSSTHQGKHEKVFAVGGKGNGKFSSPVSKVTVYICGKETFTTAEDGAKSYIKKTGETNTYNVKSDDYKDWFKFEAGDKSHNDCNKIVYRLVDKDCSKDSTCTDLSSTVFKLEDGTIKIDLDKMDSGPVEAYLEAKTGGKVKAYK